MIRSRVILSIALAWMLPGLPSTAAGAQEPDPPTTAATTTQTGASEKPAAEGKGKLGDRSPWLLVPVVSSNPKLGTSFGGMGASGNGSRFGSLTNWEEFTEWQWMTVGGQPTRYPF